MAAADMLKITKIAIYLQRFDRSLRSLVGCRKMALLTAPAVKNFEFHKSKSSYGTSKFALDADSDRYLSADTFWVYEPLCEVGSLCAQGFLRY